MSTSNLTLRELIRQIDATNPSDPLIVALLDRVTEVMDVAEIHLSDVPVSSFDSDFSEQLRSIVLGTAHERDNQSDLIKNHLFYQSTKDQRSNYYRNPAGGNV